MVITYDNSSGNSFWTQIDTDYEDLKYFKKIIFCGYPPPRLADSHGGQVCDNLRPNFIKAGAS